MNIAKSTRLGLAEVNKNRVWLAHNLSVTKQYISSVCNGKTVPSTEMIERLAALFSVPVSEFIKWGE